MTDFYTWVQYFGPSAKVNDYLDMALSHMLVSSKRDDRWVETHRFNIDAILKLQSGGFNFSNRARVMFNTDNSEWLYRNRVRLTKPVKLFDRSFTPFVSNEFFFDLSSAEDYNQNRASLGVAMGFFFNSRFTLAYMARGRKAKGKWSNTNVLETALGISF